MKRSAHIDGSLVDLEKVSLVSNIRYTDCDVSLKKALNDPEEYNFGFWFEYVVDGVKMWIGCSDYPSIKKANSSLRLYILNPKDYKNKILCIYRNEENDKLEITENYS